MLSCLLNRHWLWLFSRRWRISLGGRWFVRALGAGGVLSCSWGRLGRGWIVFCARTCIVIMCAFCCRGLLCLWVSIDDCRSSFSSSYKVESTIKPPQSTIKSLKTLSTQSFNYLLTRFIIKLIQIIKSQRITYRYIFQKIFLNTQNPI